VSRFFRSRVNGMRGYLAERDEDEGALGHARVRDFEAGQADVDVVEEKDVEVERPGAVGDSCRAVAANSSSMARRPLSRVCGARSVSSAMAALTKRG